MSTRSRGLAFAALVVGWFGIVPGKVAAQDIQVYKDQVRRYLADSAAVDYLTSHNYTLMSSGLKTGYIRVGDRTFQDAHFMLQRGYLYAFTGVCDEDCGDVDFIVLDPDGREVGKDQAPDDQPSVFVIPRKRGVYTVRATIPTCSAPIGCYWAVAGFWK